MGFSSRATAVVGSVVLAGTAVALAPADATPPDPVARAVEPRTRTIDASALRRGADASVDYVQDGAVHSGGRTIRVRTPVDGGQWQLLGRAPGRGWLVAVRKDDVSRVVAVRRGHADVELRRTRRTTYDGDSWVGWLLSRDGTSLVSTLFDRGGTSYDVRDLDGHRLGSGYSGGFFSPFDADAGHLVTWGENEAGVLRIVDWTPPGTATVIARRATFASIADDLLFVGTTGRLFGPTSLASPGVPVWVAPFAPLAVSPDGETVVGLRVARSGFDSPAILDVRRMADGQLLDSIAFGPRITEDTWSIIAQHEQTVAWESERRFVFQLATRGGSVLVRCTLDRSCQQASDTGGNISFAHETYLW